MLLAPGIESCDLGFLDLMNPVNVNSSLNQGLVSRWQVVPGLEGTKFWYDLVGRNHGTLTNGPTWDGARGRPGGWGSIRFDGTDDLVDCGTPVLGSQATLTIAGWMYRASSSIFASFGWGGGQSFRFDILLFSDGNIYVTCENGALNFSSVAGSPVGWHHLLMAYNGGLSGSSRVALYLDGSPVSLSAWTPPTTYIPTGNFRIGAELSPTRYTLGNIDDVRIWSRDLSASEAKAVYEDSRAGSPQTLNWISPYYVPRQLTAQEPVPGDVYGLFGGGDFTGIQMGVPPEAIAAVGGYQGLLDFIGIPYGLPSQITPSAGNQAAARRRFYRHVVMHQTYRSILDHSRMTEVAHLALVNRIANQWNEYQAQLARSREIAIFATLLSEV